MKLATVELIDRLQKKIKNQDFSELGSLLENIGFLNHAYHSEYKPAFEKIESCIHLLRDLMHEPHSDEKIIDTLQEICELLEFYQYHTPLMHRQTWLMERMRAAGYKISGFGECYGFSNMAIQAFLAHDMQTFNQRLQTIYDLPLEDFQNNYANLKRQKRVYLESNNLEKAQEISDLIIELHAFFDGIALHQLPQLYLYDGSNQPISKKQNVRKTWPILKSVALDSDLSPVIISTFSGAYDQKDLETYLNLLENQMGQAPFALNLISQMHAITILFDSEKKLWTLVDPNRLPSEEYIHAQYLARALFDDFANAISRDLVKKGILVMGTQIITTEKNQSVMQTAYEKLTLDTRWQALHEKRKDFKDYLELTPAKLYEKFYEENEQESWSVQQILDLALRFKKYDVLIDYANMNGDNIFLDISDVNLSQIWMNLSLQQQEKILELLPEQRKTALIEQTFDIFSGVYKLIPYGFAGNFFKLIPEHEQIIIFQKLKHYAELSFLSELSDSQLRVLFKTLNAEEKNTLAQYLNINQCYVLFQTQLKHEQLSFFLQMSLNMQLKLFCFFEPEERNDLWLRLSVQQKTDLINICLPRNMKIFIDMMIAHHELSIFRGLQPQQKKLLLTDLNEMSLTKELKALMQNLSIEQKLEILNVESVPLYEYEQERYLRTHRFFVMLSLQEQRQLFLRLADKLKIDLFKNLLYYQRGDLVDALLNSLSLEQKATLTSFIDAPIVYIFQSLAPKEQFLFFLKLTNTTQAKILEYFIESKDMNNFHLFVKKISFHQQENILNEISKNPRSSLTGYILSHMNEEQQLEAFKRFDKLYGTIAYRILRSDIENRDLIMSLLTPRVRFNLIKKGDTGLLSTLQVKKILIDKINEEISQRITNKTAFDQLKFDILHAEAPEYYIDELNELLDYHPSTELVSVDMSALSPAEEFSQSIAIRRLSLHEILQFLNLDMNELTGISIKKCWLKVHSDKVKVDDDKLNRTKDYINALKTFFSMNELAVYHDTDTIDKQANLSLQLSGITHEEGEFLIQKALMTIKEKLEEGGEFSCQLNEFLHANLTAFQNHFLTFESTIINLSKAASALTHLEERRSFKKQAERFIRDIKQLSEWNNPSMNFKPLL